MTSGTKLTFKQPWPPADSLRVQVIQLTVGTSIFEICTEPTDTTACPQKILLFHHNTELGRLLLTSRHTSQTTPWPYPQETQTSRNHLSSRSYVRRSRLYPRVREAFLVTDAGDQTSFEGVPFANMTLLSSKRFAFDLESQKEEEDWAEWGEKFFLDPISLSNSPASMGGVRFPQTLSPHPDQLQPIVSSTFISIPLQTLSLTVPSRWSSLPISCASLDAVVD